MAATSLEREHPWVVNTTATTASNSNNTTGGNGDSNNNNNNNNIAEARASLRTLTERVTQLRRRAGAVGRNRSGGGGGGGGEGGGGGGDSEGGEGGDGGGGGGSGGSRVLDMLERVEKKEAALQAMMRTVVRDKRKIEETIAHLDAYKRQALATTWRRVDADFGRIFAELLPGGFARLEPAAARNGGGGGGGGGDGGDGQVDGRRRRQQQQQQRDSDADVNVNGDGSGSVGGTDGGNDDDDEDGARLVDGGLDVRVRLGGVWKASLAELSGGQRYVS